MATWDNILTQRDKEVFALSGYGKRAGFRTEASSASHRRKITTSSAINRNRFSSP